MVDYEKAITLFNGITTDENFKGSFRGRFYQLCEPPLILYLKDTGRKFFEWLNKEY